jgi:hypothetical protein
MVSAIMRSPSRFVPAIAVLAISAATFGTLSALAYSTGRRLKTELRFLDPRRAPTSDEARISIPIEYSLHSQEANDIVFLGDSTCANVVDPLLFQRLSGLRAWNLGSLRGIDPRGMLVTIKAYLSHHPKPRAVVLCVTPFCFEVDAGVAGIELSDHFVESYGPEVDGVFPIVDCMIYFIKRGAVSVWESQGSRDVFSEPLDGVGQDTYRTYQAKMHETRGFLEITRKGFHPGPMDRPGPPQLIHSDWDEGVRAIAQACNDVGVRLLIVFSPIARDVANARDFTPLEGWARDIESSCPNVAVARPTLLVYESQFMYDDIHSNAAGAEKFMPLVAKDVQAQFAK